MTDFANQYSDPIKSKLLESQAFVQRQTTIFQQIINATSNLSSDIRQIKDFHHKIEEKRKAYDEIKALYIKSDQNIQKALNNLNSYSVSQNDPIAKSKAQAIYDQACIDKQLNLQ